MLIGIDASRAARGERTGTEGYAFHLLQALLPQAAVQGHHVRLYFNAAPPPDLFPTDSRVETVVLPFARLWTHLRLGWELRQRPPDVFFTPAHVIPITFRGRAVATVHDLGYRYFPRAHTRFQGAYLDWSTRHNAQRSRRILADSHATRRDLQHFYHIPAQKIDVVYPAVDPALEPVVSPARQQEVLDKYGLTAPYLLYLGTLQPRKNLVRLVDAYEASGVDHALVLAGKEGWRAEPLRRRVNALPPALAGRVHITGYVHDVDKAALLTGATALTYPSLYEGFGFPILEAQVCGTPVLCSDNSSLPEVAGDAALFVDAEEVAGIAAAIRRLVTDVALRQQLVARGHENATRFSWAEAARQTLLILQEAAR